MCKVLKIPLEIAGFSDTHHNGATIPIHCLYKPFVQQTLTEEDLIARIGSSTAIMTGNPDGENILYAYNNLVKRKEKKRCLIVLSDGQPAASKGVRGLGRFTLQVIQEIEAEKKVDIYGLGLLSDSVASYYKNNSSVHTVGDIPEKLLDLIKRKVLA